MSQTELENTPPHTLKNTDSRTQCFVTLFHYLLGPFSLRQQQELTQIHWTNTTLYTNHSDIAEAAGSVVCDMVSIAQLATQTDHNYAGGMKKCCGCKSLLLAFYTYEQKALNGYCEYFFVATPSRKHDCFLHNLCEVSFFYTWVWHGLSKLLDVWIERKSRQT